MIQRQTLVQDEKQQEQYEASVEVEDAEETADAAQENSLMLVRGMVDDDMEHIADMKEQFSQTIDPILRMYNAAMCATTARLEIIEDEFKYRKLRCPIHHIDTRLKSAKSILGKLQKKDLDLTLSAACNNIYDIAGVRVVWRRMTYISWRSKIISSSRKATVTAACTSLSVCRSIL